MSPRRDIRMTPGEITAFLTGRTRAVVVALDAGGRPHGAVGRLEFEAPAWAAGRVNFAVYADDPLVGLLGADPRACCTVEQFPSYYEIRGVMIHGHAGAAGSADGVARFTLDVAGAVSYDFGKLPGG